MSYEIGDYVRVSQTYLAAPRRMMWIKPDMRGVVTGYASPKNVHGRLIGVVLVRWEGTGMSVPMRWDQVEAT